MTTRTETDTFGPIEVDSSRYWGAQAQRSLGNFKIGWEKQPQPIVRALGIVKRAAAETNMALGGLDKKIGETIVAAAQEVIDGKLDEHFPLVVWQTGSGTQSNMNANEVISNRAIEMMGGEMGSKKPVHPNDHVNMSQSSNDTYPTAMHIACAEEIVHRLLPALRHLHEALEAKVRRLGRHHQDRPHPYPGRHADYPGPGIFRLCHAGRQRHRPHRADPAQADGAGAGRHRRRHGPECAGRLRHAWWPSASPPSPALPSPPRPTSSKPWPRMTPWCSAMAPSTRWPPALFKIANDIRLLGSGPRSGLGELALPENEPGSSIMPGKVNPTQCEAMTQVCVQIFGNNAALTFADSQGHFELNVYNPVMAYNFLQSVRLMADAAVSFTDNCVVGIEPRRDNIKAGLERSLMLVTALAPKIGYDNAAKIAKTAHKNGTTLKEEAVKGGYVTAEEFDAVVRPEDMIAPK